MEFGTAVRSTSFACLQGPSTEAALVRLSCCKPATVDHPHHSSSLSFATSFRCRRLVLDKPLIASGGCKSLQQVVAKEGVERTYVMVKPDGVQRGIVGEIISRFEHKGFALKGLKLFQCTSDLAEEHYGELKEKPFFPKLVRYIVSGPVVCMVWEGPSVVASARKLIGATNPLIAEPGTIRGDLAIAVGRNVVHGSDSPDNAEREIALWFKEEELIEWEPHNAPWLLE